MTHSSPIFSLLYVFAGLLLPSPSNATEPPITSTLIWKEPPDSTPPRPAVLILGGFERSSRSLELVPNNLPIHFVTIPYPLELKRKLTLSEGIGLLPKARESAHQMIQQLNGALTSLLHHPSVAKNRVYVLGASFGAPFALISAAQIPEIKGVVLIHGFANVPLTAAHRIDQLWRERMSDFFSFLAKPIAWAVAKGAWWYTGLPDPRESATRLASSQKVLLFSAEADSFIPREATEQLKLDLSKSAARVATRTTKGGHLHQELKKIIPEILQETQEWMDQGPQ